MCGPTGSCRAKAFTDEQVESSAASGLIRRIWCFLGFILKLQQLHAGHPFAIHQHTRTCVPSTCKLQVTVAFFFNANLTSTGELMHTWNNGEKRKVEVELEKASCFSPFKQRPVQFFMNHSCFLTGWKSLCHATAYLVNNHCALLNGRGL